MVAGYLESHPLTRQDSPAFRQLLATKVRSLVQDWRAVCGAGVPAGGVAGVAPAD